MRYRLLSCCTSLLLALLVCLAGVPALGAPGTLVVSVPGGDYTVWITYRDPSGAEQSTAPASASAGKAAIALPAPAAQMRQPVLVALDAATGNVAVKALTLKTDATAEVIVQAADVSAVEVLRVRAIGADGQPATGGTVTLSDAKKATRTQPLLPGRDGVVEFQRVPFGRASVKVVFADGTSLSQDVDVKPDHAPGALVVELAKAALAGAAGNAPGNAPPHQSVEVPGGTADAPANAPAPPSSGPGSVGSLVALVLFAVVCYVGYRVVKERGTTLVGLLQRLGIQLPGEEPAVAQAKPAAPPPPLVPEGSCPYCGQPKNPATGECACSVASAPAAGLGISTGPAGGRQEPRLVVMQGPALGRSFPLGSEVLMIGRAAENDVPLVEDSTVSRRHASLAPEGDGYLLRDQGSANGTFVNGMRVTERVLQPGDEIQIGSSRLRFEV